MKNKLSKKQKDKIFREVISSTPIPDISIENFNPYENILVIYVDTNQPISRHEIETLLEKLLKFENDLKCNDYSDINKRVVLTQNVEITPSHI